MLKYFKDAKSEVYNKGQKFNVSRHVYLIKSGFVELYAEPTPSRRSEKERLLLFIYKPGEVFPHPYTQKNLSSGQPLTYEALSTVAVLELPRAEFRKRILANKQGVDMLLHDIQARNRALVQRVVNLANRRVRDRLLHRLEFFAERFGVKHGNKIVIDLPISYTDIADSIRTSRETVNRLMTELKQNKIIEIDRGTIIITSPKKLK